MSTRQTEFDFSRGEQLYLLRESDLPAVTIREGSRTVRVQPDRLKAILRTIDDYARGGGECFASAATIARSACISVRQCSRCLSVLEHELGLITRGEGDRSGRLIHRRIVWSELAILCHHGRGTSAPTSATSAPTSATSAPTSATSAPTSATGGRQTVRSAITATNRQASASEAWAAAAAELRRLGVVATDSCLESARQRGATPQQVQACLRLYANRRGSNGLGALVRRIGRLAPGDDPEKRWPSPLAVDTSPAGRAKRIRQAVLAAACQRGITDPEPICRQIAVSLEAEGLGEFVSQYAAPPGGEEK